MPQKLAAQVCANMMFHTAMDRSSFVCRLTISSVVQTWTSRSLRGTLGPVRIHHACAASALRKIDQSM